jgi:hypothetical protein
VNKHTPSPKGGHILISETEPEIGGEKKKIQKKLFFLEFHRGSGVNITVCLSGVEYIFW